MVEIKSIIIIYYNYKFYSIFTLKNYCNNYFTTLF